MSHHQKSWKEKDIVALKVLEIREDSLKCTQDGKINFFLPVSQIEYDEDTMEIGKVSEIAVPRWLMRDKGIV